MLMNLGLTAVLAMAASPGGGAGGSQQGNMLTSLVPLAVIFAIFYFLMIRPQQKQQKKHREMLSTIKKGDRVVTRGGLIGTVYGIAENIVTLEVAENVRVKFNRDAISGVQTESGQ
ncbi:MAG: preprotein translocase subunit YajC [Pseudomonadota bacterium]